LTECPRCHTQYDNFVAFCGVCGGQIPGNDPLIARPADPLIGMVIEGRYRIIDLIGRGGMGAVYRVEHVKMGKIMAVKILSGELSQDRDLAARFTREAEMVSRLSHSNTVSVFDFGSHQGMMYLVMEYIDGRDLAVVLRNDGPLALPRAAAILIQICSALGEAHGKDIVHRDLKPENVLVCLQDEQEDFVKVLDFGLAKLRTASEKLKITQAGCLVGTPYYMAPEHIRSESIDGRSDIYALGAMLFKLLTGESPYTAETPMGVITQHLTQDIPVPSQKFPELSIPAVADEIVIKAMAKSPNDRYQSAEELRSALADAVVNMSVIRDPIQRFSSGPPGAWQMGEQQVPPTTGWELGKIQEEVAAAKLEDAKEAQAEAQTETQAETQTEGRNSALSKSVIIGTRKVEISTKSDFMHFESAIKRKRVLLAVVGLVVVAALIFGVVWTFVLETRDNTSPTLESEPNDSPDQADPLTANTALAGFISGSGSLGDVDWFRLRGPASGPWAVQAEVKGVAGLDLALQLIDPQISEPLVTANRGAKGEPESITPIVVNKQDVYLMIQEIRLPGVAPGSFPSTAYRVTYRVYDYTYFEVEPNNSLESASKLELKKAKNAALTSQDSVDWFCLAEDVQAQTVQLAAVPGVDLTIKTYRGGQGPLSIVNNGGPGVGESLAIPTGVGTLCFEVGQVTAGTDGAGTVKEAVYQILAQ
jgi:eukaryotic-like serine/threonine-protein kinase